MVRGTAFDRLIAQTTKNACICSKRGKRTATNMLDARRVTIKLGEREKGHRKIIRRRSAGPSRKL